MVQYGHPAKQPTTAQILIILARSMWQQGIRSSYRKFYWKFFFKSFAGTPRIAPRSGWPSPC